MTEEQRSNVSAATIGRVPWNKNIPMTEEQKAKISAANVGRLVSAETCAKMSVAHAGSRNSNWGITMSEEQKTKISIARKGHVVPVDARAKMSMAHMGQPAWNTGVSPSDETRAKTSVILMGNTNALGCHHSEEANAKRSMAHWRGGAQASHARRRILGFIPLNKPFTGCEGHHIDNEQVIYIPKELHRSVYHRQSDGYGMAQINVLATSWLTANIGGTK